MDSIWLGTRRIGRASKAARSQFASWADNLDGPHREAVSSRRKARVGGFVALVALVAYLYWRCTATMPAGGSNFDAALALIIFEALPVVGIILKLVTLWDIDSSGPPPSRDGIRPTVAVLIPTYNEPAEVIAPTIAAACALLPRHETWVLDDGDRTWVAEMCEALGARYVSRDVHNHAKAGNLNHALAMIAAEERDHAEPIEVVAVLDCDHVPLPNFLTATLPWFDDPSVALVQAPQSFYNSGAFDDDGRTGEQGLFFNVQMRARARDGDGPFWCGSTSLLRVAALHDVGGVATETITEDMHTTLKLIRRGWRTVYHHQTLALGLAPGTADQYLIQRRRWGLGYMQVLMHERLWAAKGWLSWRNYYEYLSGTLWWLEGVITVIAFAIPATILLTGAHTSTAAPLTFTMAFTGMFMARLWGTQRLLRREVHWPTAVALRIFRIPIGFACAWWLLTRKTLRFEVTPKDGDEVRTRGSAPRVLVALGTSVALIAAYAGLGLAGIVPWHSDAKSTTAAGTWLVFATLILALSVFRIRADVFASSRRSSHRFPVATPVLIDGAPAQLLDLSLGGASVRLAHGTATRTGLIELTLPAAAPIKMQVVRSSAPAPDSDVASLQIADGDWAAMGQVALWLFHTPADALDFLPSGVPAAAIRRAPAGADDRLPVAASPTSEEDARPAAEGTSPSRRRARPSSAYRRSSSPRSLALLQQRILHRREPVLGKSGPDRGADASVPAE